MSKWAAVAAALLTMALTLDADAQSIRRPGNCAWVEDCTTGGTGPNDPRICVDENCTAGQELIYDAVNDCFTCCTGVGCGDVDPCDPTECVEGTVLVWDDTSMCFRCTPQPDTPPICDGAVCNDGDELVYDAVNECWDCCGTPTCGDIPTCGNGGDCNPGDILVYNATDDCWQCSSDPDAARRFLYRDQDDTIIDYPVWNVGTPCCDPAFDKQTWRFQLYGDGANGRNGSEIIWTANNTTWPGVPPSGMRFRTGQDDGAGISFSADGYNAAGGGSTYFRFLVNRTDTGLQFDPEDLNFYIDEDGGRWEADTALDNLLFNGNSEIGFSNAASPTNANSACIDNDGADRLYHDTDCDGVKDAGEEYIDSAGGGGLWTAGTNGLYYNSDGVIVGADAAPVGVDGGAGDLTVDDDMVIKGGRLYHSPSLSIVSTTADGADTGTISLSAGGGVNDTTRGATMIGYGNENGFGDDGSWYIKAGDDSGGSIWLQTSNATASAVYLIAEDGTTDNQLRVSQAGFVYTGNAGDNVLLDDAILLGFGGTTSATAACLVDDGSDRIFHDTDCDNTKDAGEEYIDQAGGVQDDCTLITAGQMDAIEAAFATLGTDTSGTNVRIRYRAYDDAVDEYSNFQTRVPANLDTGGNVSVEYWTRGDATVDVSGLDVIWSFDYVGRADAESYDAAYTSDAFPAETYTSADDTTLFVVSQTIAASSFTAGDLLFMRFWRDANNGSDTYDGDAHLLEARVCFPVSGS